MEGGLSGDAILKHLSREDLEELYFDSPRGSMGSIECWGSVGRRGR